MESFNYYALIVSFYAGIFDQIKQGIAFEMAAAMSNNDLWAYPEDENRLSNLIVEIHYLNVQYAMNKAFIATQIEFYRDLLESIKEDDLTEWLNEEEIEHLNESILILNSNIDNFYNKI